MPRRRTVPADGRIVRRIQAAEDTPADGQWPVTVPAVAALLRDGLDLPRGITFLVGENGSGKSTLVEAVATVYGLAPEGGTPFGGRSTRPTESPLHRWIRLERSAGAPRWGFFLRAETMHGYYTYLAEEGIGGPDYHALSHGESFLELLHQRFGSPGFYCLDEPEAALSFSSQLALVGALHDLAAEGAQILCATHSPLLTALPGCHVLELGDWGLRPSSYDELGLVQHWKAFLAEPGRYLRHVL